MIQLDKIILRQIEIPLVDPFRSAGGTVAMRRVILAQVFDVDGVVTWSECVAQNDAGYSRETVDSCWTILNDALIPSVLHRRFDSPRDIDAMLSQRAPHDRMARATIEMASWAIIATKERKSLASLLARDSQPRTEVETGIALGMYSSSSELADRCSSARDDGYRRIKIKIEPGRDTRPAQTALNAVDNRIPVTVDANASYSISQLALLRELDRLGLAMIEQPLGTSEIEECANLQSLLQTPICLDESISDTSTTGAMIALSGARIVNLKPGRVGGFTQALEIHDMCMRAGLPVWCGGMLETGIGRAYNVALASLPNFTLPGDLSPSSRYWKRDVITEPWVMNDGKVRVPLEQAGTGIEVDVAFVDSIAARVKIFS